ncbi:hypothetical protein AcV5_002312 [Taiwanofungus camphoratus]|nr:hypothetical protein AcV5_002312 [Antrodia cinnamomea]
MAPHTYFRRLPNLDVILHDPVYNTSHLFTVAQLRLYSKFDRNLRDHLFDKTSTPIPGGYEKFQEVWARDRACTYQFSEYNAVTGEIITHGQPITIDSLAPHPDKEEESPGYSENQKELIQVLLWGAAQQMRKQEDGIAKQQAERKEKRKGKRASMQIFGLGDEGGLTAADGEDQRGPEPPAKRKKMAVHTEAGPSKARHTSRAAEKRAAASGMAATAETTNAAIRRDTTAEKSTDVEGNLMQTEE